MAELHRIGVVGDVANRIAELREARGWSRPKLGERAGTSGQQIERLEKGQRRLSDVWLDKLGKAFGVEPWTIIAPANTPMPAGNVEPAEMPQGFASVAAMPIDVPVYGTSLGADLATGAGGVEKTIIEMNDAWEYVRRPASLATNRHVYALRVAGSSMEPKYDQGELIYIDPRRTPSIGDYVVVQLRDDSGQDGEDAIVSSVVKRLVRRSASHIELGQFNPQATFSLETKVIVCVHRVIPWGEILSL